MHYLRFGSSKRFIVFLHGWGSDLNSFLWLTDFFIDEYSLIFLDFYGFGKSGEPSLPFSVSDYVEALKDLLDDFSIEELIFVAHSFGGRVAIKFMFNYQSSYNKTALCLVDSAGLLPKRNLVYWFKIFRYKILKKKSEKNTNLKSKLDRFGSDDYKKLSPIMKKTFIKIVNEDLTKYAKYLKCKTIIIWGSLDRETKPYMARKLKRLISESRLIFLKKSGHFCFIEKKEEFVIILDTFLKNL